MKVGTDGVLLGGWVKVEGAKRILDIGTGTGLIALMLVQRSSAQIDALELETEACQQAQENVQLSPWVDRIKVIHNSIQAYMLACSYHYDLLVSNPPFFDNGSIAPSTARMMARQSGTLSQLDLLQAAQTLLSSRGRLAVIYPVAEAQKLLDRAESFGLTCCRKLWVKPREDLSVKRVVLELERIDSVCKCEFIENTLVIEQARHVYTPEFITLIKGFYLKYG